MELKSLQVSFFLLICFNAVAQPNDKISIFQARDSVRVTIDQPLMMSRRKPTIIVFYALPNGNTTEQTMGKNLKDGDDWHFDIQHIRAQTKFIRRAMTEKNFVVIYLENNYKSWPAWKQHHTDFRQSIPWIVDSLVSIVPARKKEIYLNGHSGGGSFIFGYIAGIGKIPSQIKRISFLDSDYGYDSSYYTAFDRWLKHVKGASLTVFAYNDSIALLNGKPFVSATGGTWYRSKLFLNDLGKDFRIDKLLDDSLIIYHSDKPNIGFFFKTNPDRKIFHTVQVERNGFIHSIFSGTRYDSKGYLYYGDRAYNDLIE